MQAASTKEMFDSWRAGNTSLLAVVYSYMMSCVGDALEVAPGEEFRVALREAQQVSWEASLPLAPEVCLRRPAHEQTFPRATPIVGQATYSPYLFPAYGPHKLAPTLLHWYSLYKGACKCCCRCIILCFNIGCGADRLMPRSCLAIARSASL